MAEMTPEHLAHMLRIKDKFIKDLDIKYPKGVEEHGGKLWEMPIRQLAKEISAEALDQYTYIFCLTEAIELLIAEIEFLRAELKRQDGR